MESEARQHLRRVDAHVGNSDGRGLPLQHYAKLHVPRVLIDGSVQARAVDDKSGVRTGNVLQAQKRSISGNFVLEHELTDDVSSESKRKATDELEESES